MSSASEEIKWPALVIIVEASFCNLRCFSQNETEKHLTAIFFVC